jgi:arginine utilization protein RocB
LTGLVIYIIFALNYRDMEKIYNLKATERAFFNMYVELMTVQSPINKLRKQERQVLAETMYQNSVLAKDYKNPEDPKKWRELLSYNRKQEMAEAIGNMSEASFANCLSSLRKHGLLNVDNYLHERLRIYPNEKNGIVFNFTIRNAKKTV